MTALSGMPHGTMWPNMREVGSHVEREPVHRAATGDAHADGGDLAGRVGVGADPHAGVAGEAVGAEAEVGERVDQQVLDRRARRRRCRACRRRPAAGQREDRVADELAGAVVGHVAAPVGPLELGTHRRRGRPAGGPGRSAGRACRRAGARAAAGGRRATGRGGPAGGRARRGSGREPNHRTRSGTRPPRARRSSRASRGSRTRDGGTRWRRRRRRHGGPSPSRGCRPSGWRSPRCPAASVTTTGFRNTPSVERIITCGWLMTGRLANVPAPPAFVIVTVPPVMSSAESFFVRARLARSDTSRAMRPQPLVLRVVDDRHDQALVVEVHRDADVDVVVHDQLAVADGGVHVRELGQRVDQRPGDEREVGEAEALARLELLAVRPAGPSRPPRSRPP